MRITPFTPRFPWIGGDLQTLRNRFVYRERSLEGVSGAMRFPLSDGTGDVLTGTLSHPAAPDPAAPLVMMIHGLTGSENSAYMVEAARFHMARGRRVLRMNMRGAGSSAKTCSQFYHAGRWTDMVEALRQLPASLTSRGVVVIGYSMGGSYALNMLARLPDDLPVIGGASVSAPIDPMSAARRLMERRNAVYQRALVKEMQATYLALEDDAAERALIASTSSVFDFDNRLTGPRHGYADAEDYYAQTAAGPVIGDIRVPCLIIHAQDDPWIPVAPYAPAQDAAPPNVEVIVARSGGHVGFHAADAPEPWHDRRVSAFINGLTAS